MVKGKKVLAVILSGLFLVGQTGCTDFIELKGEYQTDKVITLGTSEDPVAVKANGYTHNMGVIGDDMKEVDGVLFSDTLGSTPYTPKGIDACLLIDDTDGETLISFNGYDKKYPASMTKVMTGILIMEALDSGKIHLDDIYTLKNNVPLDPDAARLSLKAGDTISVKDLVYGFLVRSLNDCGVVLAEMIAGSEKDFVEMMNAKAKELGATHTHFVNCHGLHDEEHYVTPYDLYLIFREFAKYPLVQEIDSTKKYTIHYTTAEGEAKELTVNSTNGFMSGKYKLPQGVEIGAWKSGTTKAAGSCLIMELYKGEKTYYVVGFKGENRDSLYKNLISLINLIP